MTGGKQMGLVLALAALAGFWARPAAAQMGPCTDDVTKFCKDVERGQGRIRACLKQHEAELSAACKKHVDSMGAAGGGAGAKGQIPAALKSCETDIEKWCKGIQPGGGRLMKCLEPHRAELSPSCKLPGPPAAQAPAQAAPEKQPPAK